MYPKKKEIQRLITYKFTFVTVFVFSKIVLDFIGNSRPDYWFDAVVTVLRFWILVAMFVINVIWTKKSIECPNCKGHSYWFAEKVVWYYAFHKRRIAKKTPPPECPHCGRRYGDYTPK